ncbi:ATP synthase F1 subunit epsilon [Limobrevibacterium gyesilva]|uniref:ATP synthase epsilon chain n=1 Tax=Limobrevibacterium gyesilva TaxID=2991712 RepID=A0AA41YIJ7_9PROT|nr:ATP synthase F1 subunit epsilon [Limobrevibacterium gyesilva]MCW3473709.1 ATP synthase F1 subunit epsilon [Limobrevibacterium gyesilva]
MPVDLEIVSPEKLLLSRPVDMVVVPASEGELGVLPGHSPMIVLLRGGTIRLYEGNRVTDQLFVSGGFAEVTPERVTVLANEATPVEAVSRAEGQRRLAAAEAEYAAINKLDVAALDAAMDRVQSARAMIEAAQAA